MYSEIHEREPDDNNMRRLVLLSYEFVERILLTYIFFKTTHATGI